MMLLPFMPSGRNRTLSLGRSSSDGGSRNGRPRRSNVVPALIEYCHLPLVAVSP